MANPFLFTDDEPVAETDAFNPASNPFFTGGEEYDDMQFQADNPFICSESNPFADTAPATNEAQHRNVFEHSEDIQTTHAFFDPGINDKENVYTDANIMSHNEIFEVKPEAPKKPPPPRPTPPSQVAAQDLISTLTDQLDLTSTKLLGQIPVTRTPSPVSMRDLHSPSPTPDMQVDDLLDIDQDNPFMSEQAMDESNQGDDMLDLLCGETPAPKRPPPPKSNQDILSLFSSPAKAVEKQKPDLLFDDIMDVPENSAPPEETQQVQAEPAPEPEAKLEDIFAVSAPPIEAPAEVLDEVLPEVEPAQSQISEPVEQEAQETHVIEEPIYAPEPQHEPLDQEEIHYEATVPSLQVYQEQENAEAIPSITYDYHETEAINPHELYVGATIEPYISSADISEIATPFSPSMRSDDASSDPVSENPFMDAPAPSQPQSFLSSEPDAFDAFAAKFESRSRRSSLTNSFVGVADTNAAWGADAAEGGSGFNDDGFGFDADDNFGSMQIQQPDEDSDEDKGLNVVIRAKDGGASWGGVAPSLAPPPKPPAPAAYQSSSYNESEYIFQFELSAYKLRHTNVYLLVL